MYADDSATGGKLSKLKQWWDLLSSVGPRYGYFPNATKTILIVKKTVLTDARTIFGDCDIQVTAEGHHYLGGVIGTPAFEQLFLRRKVDGWIDDLKTLSLFAKTQLHASYAAFCHGLSFRWNYFFHVSSCSTDLFLPLEHLLNLFSFLVYWVELSLVMLRESYLPCLSS